MSLTTPPHSRSLGAEPFCQGTEDIVWIRAYCAEELVAEIASAFLSAELRVTQDTRADHAQYIGQWLELMKEDSRAIFTAAARASEAVAYLKRLQT